MAIAAIDSFDITPGYRNFVMAMNAERIRRPAALRDVLALPADARYYQPSLTFDWIAVGGFTVPMGLLLDPLSSVMILVVSGIGSLIHVYSVGYMGHDESCSRFFAYLNLFMFAMLLAGLQTIPVPVYEAARIDGASAWERFRYITLPLMRGPSLIVLTLSVIYTLNVFEIILIITGGGPGAATSVVTYYAYQQGFNFFKLGPASAVTVIVFLVLAVISIIYIRLLHSSEKV